MARFIKAAALCILFMFSSQAQAAMIDFNGALDLTYYDWEKDGYQNGYASFDTYEFYLLGSVDIAQDVKGYFETRYERVSATVELRQGYMEWQFSKYMGVRMGFIYMPVGKYWESYYASTRKLASYVMAMRLINVTPWGDSGIMFKGEAPISELNINYMLSLTNGLNQSYISAAKPRDARQAVDNNDDKTMGARIGFALPSKGVEIGFSGASGKYDNLSTKALNVLDTDFMFRHNDLEIKGEWVQSQADDLTTTKLITSKGYYAHAAYKVVKNLAGINYIEPVLRYEEINAGRTITDRITIDPSVVGIVSNTSFGVNISPREHFLIKFEYDLLKEEKTSKDNNVFYVQTSIDF